MSSTSHRDIARDLPPSSLWFAMDTCHCEGETMQAEPVEAKRPAESETLNLRDPASIPKIRHLIKSKGEMFGSVPLLVCYLGLGEALVYSGDIDAGLAEYEKAREVIVRLAATYGEKFLTSSRICVT